MVACFDIDQAPCCWWNCGTSCRTILIRGDQVKPFSVAYAPALPNLIAYLPLYNCLIKEKLHSVSDLQMVWEWDQAQTCLYSSVAADYWFSNICSRSHLMYTAFTLLEHSSVQHCHGLLIHLLFIDIAAADERASADGQPSIRLSRCSAGRHGRTYGSDATYGRRESRSYTHTPPHCWSSSVWRFSTGSDISDILKFKSVALSRGCFFFFLLTAVNNCTRTLDIDSVIPAYCFCISENCDSLVLWSN